MNRAGLVSWEKVMEGVVLFRSLRIAYYQASAPMSARSTPSESSPAKGDRVDVSA